MADWSACQTPVVLGFKSRSDQYLDLFHSSTQFKSSVTLVYIQLKFLTVLCSILIFGFSCLLGFTRLRALNTAKGTGK